jgi:hypothetical protein
MTTWRRMKKAVSMPTITVHLEVKALQDGKLIKVNYGGDLIEIYLWPAVQETRMAKRG